MGITKTDKFTKQQNEIANLAKAFSHPARVAILEHLLNVNTCINGDLVKEIGLAQATISQHLKELKNLELIQGNISGTSVCYCINPIKWTEVNIIFNEFIGKLKMNNCC
ncbi:MAG: ArsR/SmtB family transcription factor [Chitinophagales bacterium]|mgnify:FL=1